MKAWLSQAGVPFVVVNVMTDAQGYDQVMALGFRRVPLTRVGDAVVAGYDPAALDALTRPLRAKE